MYRVINRSCAMISTQIFVAPDLAKPTYLDCLESNIPTEMVTVESNCDDEITRSVRYSSEVVYASQSHLECEERYKQLKVTVVEMERTFDTKIKELESSLETYKSELGRLNKQMQSNNEQRSHCHVMVPKQTICYCYAQVGAHSHYIAGNYNIQQY